MGEFIVLGIVLAIIIAIIFANENEATKAAQKRKAANELYHAALDQLKADPMSADLRQQVLALGRSYATLTRQGKGVAIYDEIAIANDISAATGGR